MKLQVKLVLFLYILQHGNTLPGFEQAEKFAEQLVPSEEVDRLVKENRVKSYLRYFATLFSFTYELLLICHQYRKACSQVRALRRELRNQDDRMAAQARSNEIGGFICACTLIRESTKVEYDRAVKFLDGEERSSIIVWENYLRNHDGKVALNLRGSRHKPGLLKRSEIRRCAEALSLVFKCCCDHVRRNAQTVKVLDQFMRGTSMSILEILKKEDPKFLITVSEMELINIFLRASEQVHGKKKY